MQPETHSACLFSKFVQTYSSSQERVGLEGKGARQEMMNIAAKVMKKGSINTFSQFQKQKHFG